MHDGIHGRSLFAFFETVFCSLKLDAAGECYTSQYRAALREFAAAIGRKPMLDDLSGENIRLFLSHLEGRGLGKARRQLLRQRLASIWLYAFTLGLVAEYEAVPFQPRQRVANGPQPSAVEPWPEPGPETLWHFFETVFHPQRLIGCAADTVGHYYITLRQLRLHYGRDIRLDELTDELAADHFGWMIARGSRRETVNSKRAHLFSIWRFALKHGLVACGPTINKLLAELDPPDAWSEEEASRIVDATAALKSWQAIGGLPANLYFRAVLLVAWWTGLRRGSLFKLRVADLSGEWLTVPGAAMKNKRGRRYRLGLDAVEAVKAISEPARQLLFPQPANRRTRFEWFYPYFNELLRVAEIAPSTRLCMTKLHKWRRTVATHVACSSGVEAASALLNHSGPEVTKRYIDESKLPGHDATALLPSLTKRNAS